MSIENEDAPAVRARVVVTPGRNPLETAERFFTWDAYTVVLTAALDLNTRRHHVAWCSIAALDLRAATSTPTKNAFAFRRSI